MANPVGFEGVNCVFLGSGDVRDLQVHKADGMHPQIISAWRLTPEELELVAKTGVVWLSVYSRELPPVLVSAHALVTVDDRPSVAEPYIPLRPHGDKDVG